jgi:hypothetical protein
VTLIRPTRRPRGCRLGGGGSVGQWSPQTYKILEFVLRYFGLVSDLVSERSKIW